MRRLGDRRFLILILEAIVVTVGLTFYFTRPDHNGSVILVGGGSSSLSGLEQSAPSGDTGVLSFAQEEDADSAATEGGGLGREAVALRKQGLIHRAVSTLRDGLAVAPENPDIHISLVRRDRFSVRLETADQLGVARPANSLGDVGAVEIP